MKNEKIYVIMILLDVAVTNSFEESFQVIEMVIFEWALVLWLLSAFRCDIYTYVHTYFIYFSYEIE